MDCLKNTKETRPSFGFLLHIFICNCIYVKMLPNVHYIKSNICGTFTNIYFLCTLLNMHEFIDCIIGFGV